MRKKNMVAILQLLASLLILLSFALVVGVPVVLVSPGEWEKSKGLVYTAAGLWFGLVIMTAAFNSFVI
uniref:Photosystem II reaction center protein Z n=1 Tax=Guillardia theta TaxID=55529 RepID=A0A0U2ID05_GUITH|nr:photosystem II protein Z [Guillardia theta]